MTPDEHQREHPVSRGETINVGSFTLVVVGLVALIAVRILAVAGWDYQLARSIVSGVSFQDLPALVVGLLMSDIHKTTLLLVAVSGYFFFGALGQHGMQRWAVALAAAFAALGLRNVVVSSESFEKHVASIVAISAIIVVAIQWMILMHSPGFLIPLGQLAAVIVAMIAAVGIATSPTPWQAREYVHTATEVIPGWVIGGDTRWLRVLTDTKPRRVQLLRVADIEARRITP